MGEGSNARSLHLTSAPARSTSAEKVVRDRKAENALRMVEMRCYDIRKLPHLRVSVSVHGGEVCQTAS